MVDPTTWEQARLIHSTQILMHREHLRQVCCVNEDNTLPMLTAHQVQTVMTVYEHHGMTLKRLTQVLHIKAPAASTMVDRLVEMGILTREENQADRREVIIKVSAAQEEKILEIERRHLQLTVDMFKKLGPEYVRMWVCLCERIKEVLTAEQGQ